MNEENLKNLVNKRMERNSILKKEFDGMCQSDLETVFYYVKWCLQKKYGVIDL